MARTRALPNLQQKYVKKTYPLECAWNLLLVVQMDLLVLSLIPTLRWDWPTHVVLNNNNNRVTNATQWTNPWTYGWDWWPRASHNRLHGARRRFRLQRMEAPCALSQGPRGARHVEKKRDCEMRSTMNQAVKHQATA